MFYIGLSLLFFLPLLETAEKGIGFTFLLLGSIFLGLSLLKSKIKFDLLEFLFGLFLLSASLSTVFSWSVSRSFLEMLRYAAYFVIFLSVRRTVGKKRSFFEEFFFWMIIINSIILSIISISYLLPRPLFAFPSNMNLYYPTFGHNHLAGMLLLAIPLILGRFFDVYKKKEKKKIHLWGITLCFFLIYLIFTYSRMAYIVVLFYPLLFFNRLFLLERSNWIYLFNAVIIIIFLAFQLFFIFSFKTKKPLFLPKQFYKPIFRYEWKIAYFHQALEGIKTYPILGTGFDTFRYVSAKYAENLSTISWFTHNYFLQLFSEVGILGGGVFIVFIIFVISRLLETAGHVKSNLFLAVFVGLVGSFLNNLVDYDWQFMSLFLYFWIGLALLLPKKTEAVSNRLESINTKPLFAPFSLLLFLIALISLSTLTGKFYYHIVKNKRFDNSLLYNLSSMFVPWQASHQQNLAYLTAAHGDYLQTRQFNDTASRLEKPEVKYLMFRGFMEDGLGNFRKARKVFIQAIKASPYGAKESYLQVYKSFLNQAREDIRNGNLDSALINLEDSYTVFPTLSENTSASFYLSEAKRLKVEDQKEAYKLLNKYIEKGLYEVIRGRLSYSSTKHAYSILKNIIDK